MGVLGALLVGALGSGIWDIALKPAFQWSGRTILTAATLGSSAIKDSIYREAARGHHEAGVMFIISGLAAFLLTLPAVFLFTLIRLKYRAERLWRTPKERRPPPTLAKIRLAVRVGYGLILVLSIDMGFLFIDILKLSQANQAYTYFNQSFTICEPYMDDRTSRLIKSRFAMVEGRADYLNVMEDLKNIAWSAHQKLPKYIAW